MIIALQTLIFFREALIRALDTILRPYYKNLKLALTRQENINSDDEDSEDQVFAEYHEEKGVVFFPPVYVQRYAAVADCLMDENWLGQLEKVVDLGYHDMSFIRYLKEVPGIQHIMGVDIEAIPLQTSSDLLVCDDYLPKREDPLKVTLFQGNAADPDYRLIGCDAVVAIEMIEHMLPHDLDRFIHTAFGFIKPWIVIFTTPNGDFNILFKSLEKNGLRRLDHFFEWSREQFHDWCSNIVLRYPDYTVTCRGIGPGPPDTTHLGCCSQMAVFVAKAYHKQQELDPNSLALVSSKDVRSLSIEDMTSSYEYIPDNNLLCLTNDVELNPDILSSNKQSCVTIVLTSPIYSYHEIQYTDKTFQCNLDTELAKRFLFDDEQYRVIAPRRKMLYKIYEIEDVNNRLNCSTLQVKKFSKTTQNVIAKNKIDSLVHTREVIDEIRHLTKMLNLNKDCELSGEHTWCNINWGENAPYWNHYYKVVRDYIYPFEAKSEDSRILELISEEINRLVDNNWDDDFPSDANRMEIPIENLMEVVTHVTNDTDKVKDLLEWNGYQIVDDVVIHSRLLVDTTSMGTRDDWPDNETVSDWDTSEVHSTSLSDGSTNVPEYYGRCLSRALDHKVRKLRKLLSDDEDITSELDRVVCRLMKLALHTTKTRQSPVPSSWVQCKLFDLLTLTEKAIERRKKHYYEECTIKAIENGKPGDINSILALINVKQENIRADEIVFKYRHLINPLSIKDEDKLHITENSVEELDLEDDNDFFQEETHITSVVEDLINGDENEIIKNPKTKLDIVREWISTECENIPYHYDIQVAKSTYEFDKKDSVTYVDEQIDNIAFTSPSSCGSVDSKNKNVNKDRKPKKVHTKIVKKSSKKKLNYTLLLKNYCITFRDSDHKFKRKGKVSQKKVSNVAAPIPNSLIELCQSPDKGNNDTEREDFSYRKYIIHDEINCNYNDIAAVEKSHVISIVTQDAEEEVALRRSIGTEPSSNMIDNDADLETVLNVTKHDSISVLNVKDCENIQPQTIFLYDINEPSTSKGIRHAGLDVQCGPDDVAQMNYHCDTLSATTSFSKLSKLFSKGIKIERSKTNVSHKKTFDAGTSPDFTSPYKFSQGYTYAGIRINDSDSKIPDVKTESTATTTTTTTLTALNTDNTLGESNKKKTTIIKSNCFKYEVKSPEGLLSPILKNDIQTQLANNRVDIQKKSPTRVRSKLSCGGIHVHSFKDKEISEEVIYQGGWNERKPDQLTKSKDKKVVPKRVVYTAKKIKRSSNTSVKTHEKSESNKTKRSMKAPKKIIKMEQNNKILLNKKVPPARNRNILLRNIKKVASKSLVSNTPKTTDTVHKLNRTLFERPNIENYLPPYLKRNRSVIANRYLSKSVASAKPKNTLTSQSKIQNIKENSLKKQLITSNTEDMQLSTVKELKDDSNVYVNYQIFRNEVESNRIVGNVQSINREAIGSNSTPKRRGSPDSQISTGSTANSVGTVRAVSSTVIVEPCKRPATAWNTNIPTSSKLSSAKRSLSKFKNIIKKNRNDKKIEDKENIPTSWKNSKREFVGTTKSIFRAHTNSDSLPLSKTKLHYKKSSVKLPNIKSSSRLLEKSSSSLLSKKQQDDESVSDKRVPNLPDTIIVLESCKNLLETANVPMQIDSNKRTSESADIHIENICTNQNCSKLKSDESLGIFIKEMLVETVSSIFIKSDDNLINDISFNGDESFKVNTTSSPSSFKTVIENQDSSTFKIYLEEAINASFNEITSNTSLEGAGKSEIKLLESICSSSKQSEYFLADNQLDLNEFSSMINEPSYSVQGIFERRDRNIVTDIGGPIALQALSGFSMNALPLAGDQPEYINLVDPQSGLLCPQMNRQAESEEILVSGRSSDTYESCFVEEESFVPSWLFNLINQQNSTDESEENHAPVYPLPIAEPVLDMDGVNLVEGSGAGAGDGRGVHSDHSRDSSGRGTSVSTSETSTDTPTEAILVDPSTFVGLYEFVREAANSANMDRPNESPDTSFTTAEADTGDDSRQMTRSRTVASDIDADVSSLDTDAVDSDNYE